MADLTVRELEDLVDTVGLAEVVSELEAMCYRKAKHVRHDWQDEGLGEVWDKAAEGLCNLYNEFRLETVFTKD